MNGLQISIRGLEMPASPIRKLAPLAFSAEERGVKVYRLNIGQPDLPTPEKALDALRNIDRKTLEYSPSQGYRSLRKKLVDYYDRYQIKLSADDIIITAGGSEAVLSAVFAHHNLIFLHKGTTLKDWTAFVSNHDDTCSNDWMIGVSL